MKYLNALVIFAFLAPMNSHAANAYNYDCENDQDGAEGLCIVVPEDQIREAELAEIQLTREKGRPPRDRSKLKAQTDSPAQNQSTKTLFGASDVVSSEALQTQTGAPRTSTSSQVGVNIGAQEKIRQIETFLQPIKGPQGFGDQGPAKAGQ